MLPDFQKYIAENALFEPNKTVLLAVSGGLDSTVMAHLFHQAGFSFAVAHCNFSLRGADSDGDEEFVCQMAADYNVPFFTKKFQTAAFAEKHRIGIQEVARTLRYEWFAELMEKENFEFLATAHHLDDHIETFFLNLLRGCGISGLHGIQNKRGNIIRPLLFATRNDLENYALEQNLRHREDCSNAQTKYTRNKIRHLLTPVLEEIQPQFREIMAGNIRRFSELEKIYNRRITEIKSDIVQKLPNDAYSIDMLKLQQTETPETVLFEILTPFGFNTATISDIFRSFQSQSGKKFFAGTFILSRERQHLLLYENKPSSDTSFLIEKEAVEIFFPLHLKMEFVDNNPSFSISKTKNSACFDCEKLRFPLIIRKSQQGDSFVPFGMKGRKKLSDFFIDEKYTALEKENSWLLCSGDDIIWVIGHRISDKYKITHETKKVLMVTLVIHEEK